MLGALPAPRLALYGALAGAGFRRWWTYRQATIAGAFTNAVFGFLHCYVFIAVAHGSGGSAAGYRGSQLITYVWISQGLLTVVMLWGDTDLSARIRTGEVQADLLRPVHPVAAYLATDLGRAGHALLTRFSFQILVGAVFFRLYLPHRVATYPMLAASVLFAVLVCFGVRYLVNATAFWLLDIRGVLTAWTLVSGVATGLYFPLAFLPAAVRDALWFGTPFPSILQAPVDIAVERGGPAHQALLLAGQAAWAAVLLGCCVLMQRLAERRMVMQGG